MSGGFLRTAALADIAGLAGSRAIKKLLSSLVLSCRGSFLQFVYEAGLDGDLSEEDIRLRGSAITFQYAAIQLADDISDMECDYLENPLQTGPVLLMELNQLYTAAVAEARLSPLTIRRAAALFSEVGAGQLDEIRTEYWTVHRALRTARALNGSQHAAYLELLWSDTRLERLADKIGYDLGLLVHLYSDIRTEDKRFFAIPSEGRTRILRRAQRIAIRLNAYKLASVSRVVARILPSLEGKSR